jgi:hypothetical protein
MPVYSFSLFSPTLTANLGYSASNAQLLSVVSQTLDDGKLGGVLLIHFDLT